MGNPPQHPKFEWLRESEKTLATSPVLDIIEQRCKSSDVPSQGEPQSHTFYLMRSRDWCNIIPVTEDGKIVMVRQYRVGVAAQSLEIPGGVCDAEDPTFQAAALRELEEETGYAPLPGAKIESLGWSHTNPAILNNRSHSFIVGPVRKTAKQHLDPTERIETEEVAIAELPARILGRTDSDRAFTHALMLNAFLYLMLRDPRGPGLLGEQLAAFGRRELPIEP